MLLYRYLDLDWEPAAEQIRQYLKQHPDVVHPRLGSAVVAPDSIYSECPAIVSLFAPLTIKWVGFFVTYGAAGVIHVDDSAAIARINFPVLNCENTETKFFKTKDDSTLISQPNGNLLHKLDPQNCEEIDHYLLTGAVVVNVLQPHQVVLKDKKYPRISCTIRFNEDISYLLDATHSGQLRDTINHISSI